LKRVVLRYRNKKSSICNDWLQGSPIVALKISLAQRVYQSKFHYISNASTPSCFMICFGSTLSPISSLSHRPPTFLSEFSSANFWASATSPASFGSCHKSNCFGTHEERSLLGDPLKTTWQVPGCLEVRILQLRISGLLENPKW